MVAHVYTLAFEGINAREVDVQVQVTSGMPCFSVVGLGDKAVAESKDRVRAALSAIGLGFPAKRITVNLAPADLPKEGSHYDLPIALGLMVALDVLPAESLNRYAAIGELALDGAISKVAGALPAAMAANTSNRGLICPKDSGPEAAWAGNTAVLAAHSLISLVNHFKGKQILTPPAPGAPLERRSAPDLREVRGQETAKRALEVAAAGGHNLLMVGPPGAGKSMMAERLPGLLPPLTAAEMLEVSMVHSLAGLIDKGRIGRDRPYRAPHHSASMAAMVGGGSRIKPGEISLAHLGVLFLDELPEFARPVLDSLRQPLEMGEVSVARANAHATFPACFQLIAAMNPCRCGLAHQLGRACRRGSYCIEEYQTRISGPLLDRIDIRLDVPAVSAADLTLPPAQEGTAEAAARVARARQAQHDRYAGHDAVGSLTNARVPPALLEKVAKPDEQGAALLAKAIEALNLSARGYHRVLRVARTLADLDQAEVVGRVHIAEALAYRRAPGPQLAAAE